MGIFSGLLSKFAGEKAADIITSVGEVVDKFVQTPEEKAKAMQEIQAQVNSHVEKMAELQNAELEVVVKEMDSARNREIQIATSEKAPLINKIITPVLAIGIVVLAFILFYIVLFKGVAGVEKDILVFVLGALTGYVGMVLSYYFGSSISSKQKQDYIEKMTDK